ncbi:MAG: 50S ribosomal protein L22 [Patescibacteria group bacterium]|jgi:large subunit ribosomal protein L22
MEAISKAKFIRIAPRKSRLVVSLIRGMSIGAARRQLMVSDKLAATPVLKALNSAIANAVNNLKMDESTLVVSKAYVDEGPKIKRSTPRAQGRATPIRLRMSHITIAVSGPDEATKVKKVTAKKSVVKAQTTTA